MFVASKCGLCITAVDTVDTVDTEERKRTEAKRMQASIWLQYGNNLGLDRMNIAWQLCRWNSKSRTRALISQFLNMNLNHIIVMYHYF